MFKSGMHVCVVRRYTIMLDARHMGRVALAVNLVNYIIYYYC